MAPASRGRRGGRRPQAGRPPDFARRRVGTAPENVERILARQPWSMLDSPLLEAGQEVEPVKERLRAFARMVIEWNASASNLISRNDVVRIVARHLYESIVPARWLKDSGCARWIDLGSGAGFPAIPLALAGVPGHWTLVESRRTKTLFMRKAIEILGLRDFIIENARLEDLVGTPGFEFGFDGFVSRATMRMAPTLALAARVVAPGGSAFLWKGSGREQEMQTDDTWKVSWEHADQLVIDTGPVAVVRFVRKTSE